MAVTHHERIAAAAASCRCCSTRRASPRRWPTGPRCWRGWSELPGVVAIKEGSWESAAYDRNRAPRRRGRAPCRHDGVGRRAPPVLLRARQRGQPRQPRGPDAGGDRRARPCGRRAATSRRLATLHARIQPLATAIYGLAPTGHATARLKACMVLLGRWSNGATRPPITGVTPAENLLLREALTQAGLLASRGVSDAAAPTTRRDRKPTPTWRTSPTRSCPASSSPARCRAAASSIEGRLGRAAQDLAHPDARGHPAARRRGPACQAGIEILRGAPRRSRRVLPIA